MTLALAGLVAGAVHVLSGPDHLAAIAPYAVADKARSWRTGVRWGLGHSAGVLVVGLLVLLTRQALPVEALSARSELGVGLVLIGIGIWGIRAALAPPQWPSREYPAATRSRPRGLRGGNSPRTGRQLSPAGDPARACLALGRRRERLPALLRDRQRRSRGDLRLAHWMDRRPAGCQRSRDAAGAAGTLLADRGGCRRRLAPLESAGLTPLPQFRSSATFTILCGQKA